MKNLEETKCLILKSSTNCPRACPYLEIFPCISKLCSFGLSNKIFPKNSSKRRKQSNKRKQNLDLGLELTYLRYGQNKKAASQHLGILFFNFLEISLYRRAFHEFCSDQLSR